MALIKCKSCGEKISKKAPACPHCGEPAKKKTSLGTVLVLVLISLIMVINAFDEPSGDSAAIPKTKSLATSCIDANPEHVIKRKKDSKPKAIASLLQEAKKIPGSEYKKNYTAYCVLAEGTKDDGQYKKFKSKAKKYAGLLKRSRDAYSRLKKTCLYIAGSNTDKAGDRVKVIGIKHGKYGDNGQLYADVRIKGKNSFGAKVIQTISCIGDSAGEVISTDIK